MVEIALIKLCRPQMETSNDAMLDRIRQVEEKVDEVRQGGFVMPANAGAVAGNQQGAGNGAGAMAERPKLEKAVPEEVQEVVRNWMGIVGNAEVPMKLYLKGAKLSLGQENQLIVAVEDGLKYDYFERDPQTVEQLERLIEDFCGKSVKVIMKSYVDADDFENHFVDLTKVIQMEIEEEEE